jgi:hypothetical protein
MGKARKPFGCMSYRADRKLWTVRLPTGGKTKSGYPEYQTATFKTKPEATKCLNAARRAKQKGSLILKAEEQVAEEITVTAAIDEYIEANTGRLEAKTQAGYQVSPDVVRQRLGDGKSYAPAKRRRSA